MDWIKIKKVVLGTLRLQMYAVFVLGVIGAVSYVQARDRAHHVLGELGIGMLEGLGGLSAGVEQVELNGERFTFGAAVSEREPADLVNEFERGCADASGSLAEDFGPLIAEARRRGAEIPERDARSWTSMAEHATDVEASHGGCFVRPDDAESGSLFKRLEAFANTGKLGTLGGFRYLRADRSEDSEYTRVLAIASQGELDMDKLIPDEGDAKGSDPKVAARPPRSTRMFSARILGSGQGAYVYETEATEAELVKHFDKDLKDRGLSRVPLEDAQGKDRTDARTYAGAQGAVVVNVIEDEDGERTVTVIEFGDLKTYERK